MVTNECSGITRGMEGLRLSSLPSREELFDALHFILPQTIVKESIADFCGISHLRVLKGVQRKNENQLTLDPTDLLARQAATAYDKEPPHFTYIAQVITTIAQTKMKTMRYYDVNDLHRWFFKEKRFHDQHLVPIDRIDYFECTDGINFNFIESYTPQLYSSKYPPYCLERNLQFSGENEFFMAELRSLANGVGIPQDKAQKARRELLWEIVRSARKRMQDSKLKTQDLETEFFHILKLIVHNTPDGKTGLEVVREFIERSLSQEEAVRKAERAMELLPKCVPLLVTCGKIFSTLPLELIERMNDTPFWIIHMPLAEECFRKALALDPSSTEARMGLMQLLRYKLHIPYVKDEIEWIAGSVLNCSKDPAEKSWATSQLALFQLEAHEPNYNEILETVQKAQSESATPLGHLALGHIYEKEDLVKAVDAYIAAAKKLREIYLLVGNMKVKLKDFYYANQSWLYAYNYLERIKPGFSGDFREGIDKTQAKLRGLLRPQ